MKSIKDIVASADWKTEKHVPVIEAPEKAKKEDILEITVTVGKEIAHPNTSEHHISWISVYFLSDGEKFPYQIGRAEFNAHGASTAGPNTSTIYSQPSISLKIKTEKSGTIIAVSYCNIHGIWESSKQISVE